MAGGFNWTQPINLTGIGNTSEAYGSDVQYNSEANLVAFARADGYIEVVLPKTTTSTTTTSTTTESANNQIHQKCAQDLGKGHMR